ncbi:MAG: gamma-butyrobetaine hydroxylase-like domain-containing protein [Burkholderiales bacterium]
MTGSKQGAAASVPLEIKVRTQSRVLEIAFADGKAFSLPFELLRVYSPSAEVRGHGAGQEILQTGKREVMLTALEPVGNYAIQPLFSDGHNTGIYTWDYLYWLGANQTRLWEEYVQKLDAAGFSRESGADAVRDADDGGGRGCA